MFGACEKRYKCKIVPRLLSMIVAGVGRGSAPAPAPAEYRLVGDQRVCFFVDYPPLFTADGGLCEDSSSMVLPSVNISAPSFLAASISP